MSVIIETSIGDITVDLYTDERPRCSRNFLKLCKIKYYNFSLFHTVQENLVAQAGDPTATGRGGESIFACLYGEQARFFDMEISPRIKHTKKGLISMVNNGSGMHGSQFFFTLADNLDYLDGKHTVFGEVAEGFDILDKFNNTFCGEDNRPHQDIRIYHTIILDDPYEDPDGLEIPAMSPGPTEEMLNSDHIPCDADIDEDKGKTEEELAEYAAQKEAEANAQILEMVGDLPDADVAPPENVLFVCKLNPVTTSEDLEIIFSRFGPVVSCEVIKDSKTGESLQYAFVEFENPDHCENAFFKMDNVLIDDRRIHVDFSQSVSKLKWKGKGKGVEILPTGDAPVYVLKNQQRQNDGYDLVYEHDAGEAIKDRQTDKKRKGRWPSEGRNISHNRKHERSRSRSPMRSGKDERNRHDRHSTRHDQRLETSSKQERYSKDKKHDDYRHKRQNYEDDRVSLSDKRKFLDRHDNKDFRRKRNVSSEDERGKSGGREYKRQKDQARRNRSSSGSDSGDGKERWYSRDNSDSDDHRHKKGKKKKKHSREKSKKDGSADSQDERMKQKDERSKRKQQESETKLSWEKSKRKHKSKRHRDSSRSDS